MLRRRHPVIFPSKNSVLDPDPDANFKMATVRVADPLHFNVDPDPAVHLNADPYPAFHFNAGPDCDQGPAPHQSDANLQPLFHRPSRAPL